MNDPPARYRALTPAGRRFVVGAVAAVFFGLLCLYIFSGAWQQQ